MHRLSLHRRPAVATALLTALVTLAVAGISPARAEQCTSSSGCEFWDNDYHEYVLYDEDTVNIDVLIVPPISPFATRDIVTVEKAIDAWDTAVNDMGDAWFADNLTIHRYTLGKVVPPAAAINDPEIIVVSAEYNPVLLFGIGLQDPFGICGGLQTLWLSPPHQHNGWYVQQAECSSGGYRCLVLNTNFLLGGANSMYDLAAHEFGHCLGAGHVGDALDFDAKTFPDADVMSYQQHTHVNCVSNLNIEVLQGVYAPLLSRPSSEWLSAGDYVAMDPNDYTQETCSDP